MEKRVRDIEGQVSERDVQAKRERERVIKREANESESETGRKKKIMRMANRER